MLHNASRFICKSTAQHWFGLNLAQRSGTRTREYMLGGKRLYITAAEANASIMVPLFRTVGRALKVLEDSSLGVSA